MVISYKFFWRFTLDYDDYCVIPESALRNAAFALLRCMV
jgi:hypothetical protein